MLMMIHAMYPKKLGDSRSALRFVTCALAGRFGAYRLYQRIDWVAARRLVFVCSGNICRSPYAAELAKLRGWNTASFGIDASGGAVANDVAQRVAKARGVDLASHVSMRVADFVVRPGDLLIGMEPRHVRAISEFCLGTGAQVTLMGLWSIPQAPFLPDPYGMKDECFEYVFDLIESALERISLLTRQRTV
jgi:protein-tyrosine phosphatase